jgi:hypothetical protein
VVPNDVTELIGIYDADSTIIGELSYWVGARLGKRHCSLCDITHGLFTQRREWRKCRTDIGVPFVTFHRNDAPRDAIDAAGGSYPCVLLRRSSHLEVVLGPDDLDKLDGSPHALVDILNQYIATDTE